MTDGIKIRAADEAVVAGLIAQGAQPLTARLLAGRGIRQYNEITPALKELPVCDLLPGVSATAAALAKVCRSNEKICIIGDYDVDGVTATVLAYHCLSRLNASVSWYIPKRSEGYGLSADIVKQQAQRGIKHLLTVDNGINSHEAIACAKSLGMSVYVTDHHQPDENSNAADYVINPHVNNGGHDFFNALVGVGLSFYLMAQLRRELASDIKMTDYLDLVALGTIADCGELNTINRTLINFGVRLCNDNARPGIAALATQAKLHTISSQSIAFHISPRLNAAGRMNQADIAVNCLLAEKKDADYYAGQLNKLNDERKLKQKQTSEQALEQLQQDRFGVVVYKKEWHPGVIGIVANKVAEESGRPAFVFRYDDNGNWHGSGRSDGNINLINVLNSIHNKNNEILIRFGGHKQAAAAAVKADALPLFIELFNDACREICQHTSPFVTEVDECKTGDITLKALQQINEIAWGQGFPPPRYVGRFTAVESTPLRGGHLRLQLKDSADGNCISAICFGISELAAENIKILYSANINSYNNYDKPQLVIEKILHDGSD